MSTAEAKIAAPLLSVENLRVDFVQDGRRSVAVDDVSFTVGRGETVALVGESGSGKSVTCQALMRLLREPPARIGAKRMVLGGEDMLTADKRSIASIRGRVAAMVFQDPMTSLDPVFTIGHQIVETIRAHRKVSKKEALDRTVALLRRVEIKNAEAVVRYYPHQLSGGMLQRVMIAMALSCEPSVLIADEPTTALDVTIQAQILTLMKDLQAEFGMAILFITHDLGVVANVADEVVVLYRGRAAATLEGAEISEAAIARYSYSEGLAHVAL